MASATLLFSTGHGSMSDMRALVVYTLICALLVANFEMLTDLGEAGLGSPDSDAGASVLADSGEDPSSIEAECDHCCHAAGHLAGLAADSSVNLEPVKAIRIWGTIVPLALRESPPDLKPPIV